LLNSSSSDYKPNQHKNLNSLLWTPHSSKHQFGKRSNWRSFRRRATSRDLFFIARWSEETRGLFVRVR